MPVTIKPLSAECLLVTGDITAELPIPFAPDEDRFHLAFSDGTLIAGEYEPEDDAFQYVVETEGAGIVRQDGGALSLDWRVEWVTIGTYNAGARTAAEPGPMPLFNADLGAAAGH